MDFVRLKNYQYKKKPQAPRNCALFNQFEFGDVANIQVMLKKRDILLRLFLVN